MNFVENCLDLTNKAASKVGLSMIALGWYRYTIGMGGIMEDESPTITGPYYSRNDAVPAYQSAGGRVHNVIDTVKFHLKRPQGSTKPPEMGFI